MRCPSVSFLLLLSLSACASLDTFVNATGDLASGRTAQSVEESRQRQVMAQGENTSLRNQYATLQTQRTKLREQLSAAQAQLRGVNQKLSQQTTASQVQRDEYARLVAKQKDLQQRLTAASAAPAPARPAAAADQKAQLEGLAQEKDVLERQVNALQRAL